MNPRKAVAAIAGVAIAASIMFAAPAQAGPGDTAVTFSLVSGTLSIQVSGTQSVDLGSKTPSGALGQFTGNLLATTVTDNRNVTTGWTASASSTVFTGNQTTPATIAAANTNISIPTTAVSAITVGGTNQLSTSGLFVPVPNGTAGTGGPIGALAGGTLAGLLSGTLVTSNNSVTYTPLLTVTVPAGTPNGIYTGTITQTVA